MATQKARVPPKEIKVGDTYKNTFGMIFHIESEGVNEFNKRVLSFKVHTDSSTISYITLHFNEPVVKRRIVDGLFYKIPTHRYHVWLLTNGRTKI